MAIEIDFLESYDRDSIAAELRRIAAKLGKKTLTWDDITAHGRMSAKAVAMKFGNMQSAHKAAGLIPPRRRLTDEELLKILVDLWKITFKASRRSPLARELKEYGFPASVEVCMTRFGSWNKALVAAASKAPVRLTRTWPRIAAPKRKEISVRTRFLVFKRDGYKCRICGRAGGELELDHVIPVCRGGKDYKSNLQTLCRKCNRGKRGSLQ